MKYIIKQTINNQSQIPNRESFPDILKGIAVLFVVITHFEWDYSMRLQLGFPFWIDMAVPIFMILSGYLQAKSMQRRNYETLKVCYDPKVLFKKLFRYLFPFLIVFISEWIVFILFYKWQFSVGKFLVSLVNGGEGQGNYYVPMMIELTFVFPVVYLAIKKWHWKGLVLCGFINFTFELIQHFCKMTDAAYRLIILRYLLLIAFGCYLAFVLNRRNDEIQNNELIENNNLNPRNSIDAKNRKISVCLLIVSFIVGIIYLYMIKYTSYEPKIITMWTGTSVLAAFYIMPIVAVLLCKCKNVKCKPLEHLGKASYHIFLTQMVYYCFSWILYKYVTNMWLQLVCDLVICIVAGLIFYYLESKLSKIILNRNNDGMK